MLPNLDLAYRTALAIEQVCDDIREGVVPADVTGFAALHDHVDANGYGDLCEDEVFDALVEHFGGRDADDGMPQGMVAYVNALQDAVHAWIVAGGARAADEAAAAAAPAH